MPRQKNVYQALKWPGIKRLLLTYPCAPAKSARNNSYLVLIQIQVVVSIVAIAIITLPLLVQH